MLNAADLAVWGDPIEHSRSPRIHTAAYAVLGLAWEYGRKRVDETSFGGELGGLGASWRGLSLTMPLKRVAASAADDLDDAAMLTGAANTLLLTPGRISGFNTDVGGLTRALRAVGVRDAPTARILGAGATATSALLSLAALETRAVEVRARRPAAVAPLAALGARIGVDVTAAALTDETPHPVDVTVSTLPGGTDPGAVSIALADTGGVLFDVVYGTWPTPLARAWERTGREAASGLGMLLHQALLQVRIFVTGDAGTALDDEDAVLTAMHDALVGD